MSFIILPTFNFILEKFKKQIIEEKKLQLFSTYYIVLELILFYFLNFISVGIPPYKIVVGLG